MKDRRVQAGIVAVVALLAWALWPTGDVAEPTAPSPTTAEARPAPRTVRRVTRPAPPTVLEAPAPTADAADTDDDAARADRLRADRSTVAVCRVSERVSGRAHLINGDDGDPPYDGRLLPAIDGEVFVGLVAPVGHGWLAVDGFEPVPVHWADGECMPDPVVLRAGTAWVSGHVRNAEGEPEGRVFVEGCGTQARTDAGGHYAMAVKPGQCRLGAFRRDGLLTSTADPVDLELRSGDDRVVDFALPELPKAGLGIVIASEADGVHILDVLPGTAAADAGLQADDVVIEVDGVSTAGLPLGDFVELAVGDVGTEVEVVIRRGDQEEAWLLDRRMLEQSDG